MPPGGALFALTTLLPFLGSLFGGIRSRRNTEMTNEANMQMAEYQWSKDVEMWNMNNAYNAPQAYMDRLKKAGINPNEIFGGFSGNLSTNMPQYHAPRMDYSGIESSIPRPEYMPNLMDQYIDWKTGQYNLDLMNEKVKLAGAQAINETIKSSLYNVDLATKVNDLENTKGLFPYQLEAAKETVREIQERINNLITEGKLKEKDLGLKDIEAVQKEEDIKNTRVQRYLMGLEAKMKKEGITKEVYENGLRALGINPNDPTWQRFLVTNGPKVADKVTNWIQSQKTKLQLGEVPVIDPLIMALRNRYLAMKKAEFEKNGFNWIPKK